MSDYKHGQLYVYDATTQTFDAVIDKREGGNEYPSQHPLSSHWALDEAWAILDQIKPGIIPIDVRAFLAGWIGGRIMRERDKR